MFESSVIVANESLRCPWCDNLWELKDFSEEQQQSNCSG